MSQNIQLTPKLLQYSTAEQILDERWTDGRPVYQKTIPFGAVGTGTQSVTHGITGADFVFDAKGYAMQANGVTSIIPRLSTTPLTTSIFYDRIDATLIYGYVGTSFVTTAAITGGAVTIKYVKV